MGPAGQRQRPGFRRRWPAVSRTTLPDHRYGNAPILCRQIRAGFTPAPTPRQRAPGGRPHELGSGATRRRQVKQVIRRANRAISRMTALSTGMSNMTARPIQTPARSAPAATRAGAPADKPRVVRPALSSRPAIIPSPHEPVVTRLRLRGRPGIRLAEIHPGRRVARGGGILVTINVSLSH